MRIVNVLIAAVATLTSTVVSSPSKGLHVPLIGAPLVATSQTSAGLGLHKNSARQSTLPTLVVTATTENVLAGINPKNGDLVWRFLLDHDDPIIQYKVDSLSDCKSLILLSGHGAARARMLSLASGRVIWESHQHKHLDGILPESGFSGADVIFLGQKDGKHPDVVVLSNEQVVQRINGETGDVVWRQTLSSSADLISVRLSPWRSTQPDIQLLQLGKNAIRKTLRVLHMSTLDGSTMGHAEVTDADVRTASDIILVDAEKTKETVIAWVDTKDRLKSLLIPTSSLDTKPSKLKSRSHTIQETGLVVRDVGLSSKGHFLAKAASGIAFVVTAKKDGSLENAWNFEDASEASYSGSIDRHGISHVSRISFAESLYLANFEVLTLGPSPQYPDHVLSAETFGFDADEEGDITSATVEVSERKEYRAFVRILLTTTRGSMEMWMAGEKKWQRTEDLCSVKAVVVGFPSKEDLTAVSPFQKVLDIVQRRAQDFISGRSASAQDETTSFDADGQWLIGTEAGRLHRFDSNNGSRAVWTKSLAPKEWKNVVWHQLLHLANGTVVATVSEQGGAKAQFTVGIADGVVEHEHWTETIAADRPGSLLAEHDHDIGASPARILGNRETIFKYHNPNLIAQSGSASGSYLVEVRDAAQGELLSIVDLGQLPQGPLDQHVTAALTDNWLVVAFPHPEGGSVVQSIEWNARNRTGDSALDGSAGSTLPSSRSFRVPFRTKKLAHGHTRLGVAAKTVLMLTENDEVMVVPRRLLDPRRPMHKPTADDIEEQLMPYSPNLPFDYRSIVTKKTEALGLRQIASLPTPYESTTAVFASGLDIFSTTVAPSRSFDMLGEEFNKAQLLITATALFAVTIVLRPMVNKKRLRLEWYS